MKTKPKVDLDDAVEAVKKDLNQMLAAYKRDNEKKTFYWVGLVSRQITDIGRQMMGLEPLKQEGRAIKLPEESKLII